jgi:hypothetical protein
MFRSAFLICGLAFVVTFGWDTLYRHSPGTLALLGSSAYGLLGIAQRRRRQLLP